MDVLNGIPAWLFGLLTVAATFGCAEIGYRAGLRSADADKTQSALTVVQSAVFALMAFLLGFSFSFGIARYEKRLDLEQKEASSIATTYLRLDLLDAGTREQMRALLRRHVQARLALYTTRSDDAPALAQAHANCQQIQNDLWTASAANMVRDTNVRLSLVVQSMNQVFESGAELEDNLERRAPLLLVVLILSTIFLGGAFVGFGFGRTGVRGPTAWLVFALATSLVVFVVLEVTRPDRGLIRARHLPLVRLEQTLR